MRKKKILISILICFMYGIILNTFYRPYIYLNKIDDFGLADIGNNLTFIPGVYLIYLYTNKTQKLIDPSYCLLILGLIELASYFVPFLGTFDIKDIIGLSIGTLFLKIFLNYEKNPI